MRLFEKKYDWKSVLTTQEILSDDEIQEAIDLVEQMVSLDKYALGFQPSAVKKAIEERKTLLQLLNTPKVTKDEIGLIRLGLQRSVQHSMNMGLNTSERKKLSRLDGALSKIK